MPERMMDSEVVIPDFSDKAVSYEFKRRWHTVDIVTEAIEVATRIKEIIRKNEISSVTRKTLEKFPEDPNEDPRSIQIPRDATFLLRHNPIYCDIEAFRLR